MICIVEDDDRMRTATTSLVRSLGYATRAFASAEEYLRCGHTPPPMCLIADVQMPGMNGLEMQARMLAGGDPTPIIFVTGFPDDQIRTRALASGAVAFLIKPFSGDTLCECIECALNRSDRSPFD